MDAITIVNESARPVRVAIFRRPASDGGVTLVWRVVEVPGRGRERLPAEHFAVSLLCQLPSGYGRTKVVSFPGPPARFEVRQKNPADTPFLAAVSEGPAASEVRVANQAAVPVQAFLYREDREIDRSDFLAPGEELAFEIRPDLCLALLEDPLHPGDELPPRAQDRAVPICRSQTAKITGSRRRGFKVEVV
jgi:hypothetical protein